jgi:hypothetical protein
MAAKADDNKVEDTEEEEKTAEARLNTPARNMAIIPKKVPDNIPYI